MTTSRLDATIVTVNRFDELDARIVGFFRPIDCDVLQLQLQRALRTSDQDRKLGWDAHCLVIGSGRTQYGCVLECRLTPGVLHLRISRKNAAYLHIGEKMIVNFDPKKTNAVRRGLTQIFKPPKQPKILDLG